MPDYFEQLKEFAMKADDVNLKPVAPEDIGVEDSTYALDEIRKRVESTGRLSPAQVDELMDAFQWKDPDERWVPIKKAAPRLKPMEPIDMERLKRFGEFLPWEMEPIEPLPPSEFFSPTGIDAFESLMDSLGFSATEIPEGTRVVERSVEKIPSGDALLSASMPKRY
tara:strand:- start:2 stop:502 length:501 start_codon:yes stop_codon:yes gene_type:complete